MTLRIVIATSLLVFALACAAARAEEPQARTWRLDPDAPSYFHKDTPAADLTFGYLHDWDRGHSAFQRATLGLGYYFADAIAVRAEFTGYAIQEEDYDAVAGGAAFGFRHHLYNSGKFSAFVEVLGGVFEADHVVPPGGTHVNFTFTTGIGATYELKDNLHLITGLRYFHLSNASTQGRIHNPSANAWDAYVGVMLTF